jgi:hypothetical protein
MLMKTVLHRFDADLEHPVARIGDFVAQASHLSLGVRDVGRSPALDNIGRYVALHEFEENFVHFAPPMRTIGWPPGQS